jgi:hypothetical protein
MTDFFFFSDWCAKIYEDAKFNGWEKVVFSMTRLDLTGNENDQLTSVRVRPGCTLHLFKNSNNDGFLESLTSDISYHGTIYNDQVSSLSCTCTENEIRPPPRPGN